MENTQFKNRNRYEWVDNIKLACCILVVLGHFYQSMIASEIIKGSLFYSFSIQTMYTFHVPLFFVCSGFLYQKSNKVHNLKSWSKNVSDKLLNLGVPYFTFTLITLVIKKIFSDSVNNPADDFFKTLFINPTAPFRAIPVFQSFDQSASRPSSVYSQRQRRNRKRNLPSCAAS